jgi:hypothetical protein
MIQMPDLHPDSSAGEEFRSPVPSDSGLGLSSVIFFVLACASLVGSWLADRANKAYLASKPGPYDLTWAYILTGLFGCCGFLLLLIGVVLGLERLLQQQRRKLFAGLGLALNASLLLLLISMVAWTIANASK